MWGGMFPEEEKLLSTERERGTRGARQQEGVVFRFLGPVEFV